MKQDQFSKWNATKVKARADYTCQKCGSMENIQAHDPTGEHTNWRVGVALCGDCHSREHPDIPVALFAISSHQPYWPNISARSLAKEFSCHNRTIIRGANKLGIPLGQSLSPENKEKLRILLTRKPKLIKPQFQPKALVERVCQTCEKHFRVRDYSIRKGSPAKFCSRKCLIADKLLEYICKSCGKHFKAYISRTSRARFCSCQCYRSWVSKHKKTHCLHGHPYDEQNTRISIERDRVCIECDRLRRNPQPRQRVWHRRRTKKGPPKGTTSQHKI